MKPLYVTHGMCLAALDFPLEYKNHKKESPSGLSMRVIICLGKRKKDDSGHVCMYMCDGRIWISVFCL